MSNQIEYKATIQAKMSLEVLEETLANSIGRFGMFGYHVNEIAIGLYELKVSGDASESRYEQFNGAMNSMFDQHGMSVSYDLVVNDMRTGSGYYGYDGKQVRINAINHEIQDKLKELNELDGLTLISPDQLADVVHEPKELVDRFNAMLSGEVTPSKASLEISKALLGYHKDANITDAPAARIKRQF